MSPEVADLASLGPLETEWRALAVRRGNGFLTPDWFGAWVEHYGEEQVPFVPLLRGPEGELRGLLPLALPRSGHPRVCRIAGANLGDRFHPVSEPGDEAEVAAAAGEALAEAPEPWSVLSLDHVQVDEPWVEALAEATGRRLSTRSRIAAPLPLIDISAHESWDAYLGTRSSNFRQQVRRFARRAAREVDLRIRRTETTEELDADMGLFFDLHDKRFTERGGSSLTAERARSFHLDFAAAALEQGWLRLWFLELDGSPAAAWYGWRLGERYSYYNSGFDPAFASLSPGLVLISAVIESAFDEGAAEFDFLLGEESYKYRFAEREPTVSDVTLARSLPHPASVVTAAEYGARRAGRLIPASARRRLGLGRLARRTLMGGRGR
jgi:CelD/BcsL family acetyltransferase involved in cellulose biosynthesis